MHAMHEDTKDLRPCGTYAAARRHQRHKEPTCELCKAAIAARQRAYYHRRKARQQDATQ